MRLFVALPKGYTATQSFTWDRNKLRATFTSEPIKAAYYHRARFKLTSVSLKIKRVNEEIYTNFTYARPRPIDLR